MSNVSNKWPFAVGERLIVTKDIDLEPHATVRQGETGVVVLVDEIETNIRMDKTHRGLGEWDNCIWIIPSMETDDVLTSLQPVREDICRTVSQSDWQYYSWLRSVILLLS